MCAQTVTRLRHLLTNLLKPLLILHWHIMCTWHLAGQLWALVGKCHTSLCVKNSLLV